MKHTKLRRGIYILPNLFTTASLFAAFYSIVASQQNRYEVAAIAIFIGMIADGLDGRIARMTNTQTSFGAEYDSLSDMVTFGVAPALLYYSWSLHHFGKLGWLISFIYTAAVALRLARFNTQIDTADKRYFQGLSCTMAGAFMASFVWVCNHYGVDIIESPSVIILTAIIAFTIAMLMVSNIRYNSYKDIDLKGKVPFLYILLIVILFVAIAANPAVILFCASFLYVASGPLKTLLAIQKVRRRRQSIRKSRKNKRI